MSWTLIEHQALTSSVASVTLGSGGTIPQTYKTLKLVVCARNTGTNGEDIRFYPNGSSANATIRRLRGTGSTAASDNFTIPYSIIMTQSAMTASTFGSNELTLPNYTGSTNKPYSVDSVQENNATNSGQFMVAGLWSNTAAITSIELTPVSSGVQIASGSTFTLYGLA